MNSTDRPGPRGGRPGRETIAAALEAGENADRERRDADPDNIRSLFDCAERGIEWCLTPAEHSSHWSASWGEALEVVWAQTLLDDADGHLDAWGETRGWPPGHLAGIGAVLAERVSPMPVYGKSETAPVIRVPAYGQDGRLRGWQDRAPERWAAAAVGKWLHPPTASIRRAANRKVEPPRPAAAGLDTLHGSTKRIEIVEGATDYITGLLFAEGTRTAVVAGLGASNLKKLAPLLDGHQGKHVRIWCHRDPAGIEAAVALRRELAGAGHRADIDTGDHNDITETLEQTGQAPAGWETP